MQQPLVLIGHGLWLQMATAIVAKHLQPFGIRCVAVELPAQNKEPAASPTAHREAETAKAHRG